VATPDLRLSASSHYDFDAEFYPLRARLGEGVSLVHRALQRQGLLDYPFDVDRASQSLWPVKLWKDGTFEDLRRPEPPK
jgi:hypothetical protein